MPYSTRIHHVSLGGIIVQRGEVCHWVLLEILLAFPERVQEQHIVLGEKNIVDAE